MIKRILSIILLLACSYTIAFASDIEEVTYIPTAKYFDTVLYEINSAQESISIYMYLTSISRFRTGSKPYQLIEAVIKAKDRGVKTEVILDETIDFQQGGNLTEKELKRTKNIPAYEILKQNQVPVYFDSPSTYTHAKVIVIDNKTTILGSANWSSTALTRNIEANVLIRSEEFAKEVLTHLEEDVQRQNTRLISPQSVYLSWSFMDNPRLLGTMITSSDSKALSLYLLILRNYDGNIENKVTIDYENFKEYLEGAEDKDSAALRRDINRTLKKLDEEYKLINVTLKYADNAEVTLNDYEDPSKPYSIPKEKYIAIPHAYWTYRWSKTLPLKATVAYVLNLGYSSLSKTPPTWFYSQEYLAQKHAFSTWFFSEGTNTLKELNLVEVEYDDILTNPTDPRKANRYSPNKLYDPERLKDRFLAIENEHGKEKLQRAIGLLTIVHEQSDANAAVALIKFEDQYGLDAIRQAKEVIESKKDDNPKKNIAYLLAAIRNIGEKNIVSEAVIND